MWNSSCFRLQCKKFLLIGCSTTTSLLLLLHLLQRTEIVLLKRVVKTSSTCLSRQGDVCICVGYYVHIFEKTKKTCFRTIKPINIKAKLKERYNITVVITKLVTSIYSI